MHSKLLTDEYIIFNTHLLNNQVKDAGELIHRLVDNGTEIKDIYKYIFQRSQYKIGRLWETNSITVAQEHFCTAATQMIMSQLYPHIFSSSKNGKKIIATCIGGELHEIGIRMIADIFEMSGWDSYFIGANTPADSIIETIKSTDADILAVSASMTFNIPAVEELVSRTKENIPSEKIKILVGGRPFNISTELWKKTGADGWAPDADEAVNVAENLIGGYDFE